MCHKDITAIRHSILFHWPANSAFFLKSQLIENTSLEKIAPSNLQLQVVLPLIILKIIQE